MPENPHDKTDLKKKREKLSAGEEKKSEKSSWSKDQQQKTYYYDDSHGYEVYNPDEEETDFDAEEEEIERDA